MGARSRWTRCLSHPVADITAAKPMAAQMGATIDVTIPRVNVSARASGFPASRHMTSPAPRRTSRTSTRRTIR